MPVRMKFDNPLLELWMTLHQTYNSVVKCEDKELLDTEVTTQQLYILMAIKNGGVTTTPSQLADWLDRNANSITLIVDRMEKSGLVERVRDVKDRRSLRVAMTEKGEKLLRKGIKIEWDLVHKMLDSFSEGEIKAVTGSLLKVREQSIKLCGSRKPLKDVEIKSREPAPRIRKKAE
jgi:MarR family transcriptional regulator, organic hydroperoxide resistance regulator